MTSSVELQARNCVHRALLAALASLAVVTLSPPECRAEWHFPRPRRDGAAQAERRSAPPPPPTDRESLQGRLIVLHGQPTLKTARRDYTLSVQNSYLSHTLRDERLLNREVRVEGTLKPDGTFEAAHLFTVRDGQLYKVRYYCDICNIAALEPGNCVCCQRPTELQEIPLSEVGKDTVVVP